MGFVQHGGVDCWCANVVADRLRAQFIHDSHDLFLFSLGLGRWPDVSSWEKDEIRARSRGRALFLPWGCLPLRIATVVARFGQVFGYAGCVGAAAILDQNMRWIDAGAMPQRHEVVEQVGALSNDASIVVFDGLECHFAGFLDDLLSGLAGARSEQARRAWMILRRYFGKRSIEAVEFTPLLAPRRDAARGIRRHRPFRLPWRRSRGVRGHGHGPARA